MTFDIHNAELAERVLDSCRQQGLRLVTAESCTGGLIAAALTAISGSSAVVQGGIIAYDNRVKQQQLGVSSAMLAEFGAVSEPVARSMAAGAARLFHVPLAVAVTGVAGPGGGTATKPVGLVHIAVKSPAGIDHHREVFRGNRKAVRMATVAMALEMLLAAIDAG